MTDTDGAENVQASHCPQSSRQGSFALCRPAGLREHQKNYQPDQEGRGGPWQHTQLFSTEIGPEASHPVTRVSSSHLSVAPHSPWF